MPMRRWARSALGCLALVLALATPAHAQPCVASFTPTVNAVPVKQAILNPWPGAITLNITVGNTARIQLLGADETKLYDLRLITNEITLHRDSTRVAIVTPPGMLVNGQPGRMWVQQLNGHIRVGLGATVGDSELMSYFDSAAFNATLVALGAELASTTFTDVCPALPSDGAGWAACMTRSLSAGQYLAGIPQAWPGAATMMARGNTLRMVLSPTVDPGNTTNQYVLQWSSGSVQLRREGSLVAEVDGVGLLSGSELRPFWAQQLGGTIQFGVGSVIGEDEIFAYIDPAPVPATHVAFGAVHANGHIESICGGPPTPGSGWGTCTTRRGQANRPPNVIPHVWPGAMTVNITLGHTALIQLLSAGATAPLYDMRVAASSITLGRDGSHVTTVAPPNLLVNDQPRRFWVQQFNGSIRIGLGATVGDSELMSYFDPAAFPVQFVAFGAEHAAAGYPEVCPATPADGAGWAACMTRSPSADERLAGIPQAWPGAATMMARGNTLRMVLSPTVDPGNTTNQYVLQWSSGSVQLRREGSLVAEVDGVGLLSGSELRPFWAQQLGGTIQFGVGSVIGEDEIFAYIDPAPVPATHVAFGAVHANGHIESICGGPPTPGSGWGTCTTRRGQANRPPNVIPHVWPGAMTVNITLGHTALIQLLSAGATAPLYDMRVAASSITLGRDGSHVTTVAPPNLLVNDQPRRFWVQQFNGSIRIGLGATVGDSELMSYFDPAAFPVQFVAFGAEHAAAGYPEVCPATPADGAGWAACMTRSPSADERLAGIPQAWPGAATMMARGNTLRMVLSPTVDPGNTTNQYVLQWSSGSVQLRREGSLVAEVDGVGLLSGSELRPFWAQQLGGTIQFGVGSVIGEDEIFAYIDPAPVPATHVAFGAVHANGHIESICGGPPTPGSGWGTCTTRRGQANRPPNVIPHVWPGAMTVNITLGHTALIQLLSAGATAPLYDMRVAASSITLGRDGSHVTTVAPPNLLVNDQPRRFWVQQFNGSIRIGLGATVGDSELMSYFDPAAFPVQFVAFGAEHAAAGYPEVCPATPADGAGWAACMTRSPSADERLAGIPQAWPGAATMMARGNTLRMVLSPTVDPGNTTNQYVLQWSSGSVQLRREGSLVAEVDGVGLLSGSELRPFWAQQLGGTIQFGVGSVIGEDEIFAYIDPAPVPATHVAFGAVHANGHIESICGGPPTPGSGWGTCTTRRGQANRPPNVIPHVWPGAMTVNITLGHTALIQLLSAGATAPLYDMRVAASSITLGRDGSHVTTVAPPNLLVNDQPRRFWVQQFNGSIRIGLGATVGDSELMSYFDPAAFPVQFVAFGAEHAAAGYPEVCPATPADGAGWAACMTRSPSADERLAGIPQAWPGAATMMARGNTLRMVLSPTVDPGNTTNQYVLQWSSGSVQLRREGSLVAEVDGVGLLSGSELRPFWAQQLGGTIQFGVGSVIGEDEIFAYIDPAPVPATHVAFGAVHANGHIESICGGPPTPGSGWGTCTTRRGQANRPPNVIPHVWPGAMTVNITLGHTARVLLMVPGHTFGYAILFTNSKLQLRSPTELLAEVAPPNLLVNDQPRRFWVQQFSGSIRIGLGATVGNEELLAHFDPTGPVVESIALGADLAPAAYEGVCAATPADGAGWAACMTRSPSASQLLAGIPQAWPGAATMMARGNTLRMVLSPTVDPGNTTNQYQLEWSSGYIELRKSGAFLARTFTVDLLSGSELRPFWTQQLGGTIQFGVGSVIGEEDLFAFVDTTPLSAPFISFGASVTHGHIESICGGPPTPGSGWDNCFTRGSTGSDHVITHPWRGSARFLLTPHSSTSTVTLSATRFDADNGYAVQMFDSALILNRIVGGASTSVAFSTPLGRLSINNARPFWFAMSPSGRVSLGIGATPGFQELIAFRDPNPISSARFLMFRSNGNSVWESVCEAGAPTTGPWEVCEHRGTLGNAAALGLEHPVPTSEALTFFIKGQSHARIHLQRAHSNSTAALYTIELDPLTSVIRLSNATSLVAELNGGGPRFINETDFSPFWLRVEPNLVRFGRGTTVSPATELLRATEAVPIPPLAVALAGSTSISWAVCSESTEIRPPTFAQPSYVFTVPEDTDVGLAIGQVVAADGDPFLFDIQAPGVSGVTLDAFTGELRLSSPLDFESTKILQFVVRAVEEGAGLFSSVPVTINITDVDDVGPQFIGPPTRELTVQRDNRVGSTVLPIGLTDDATPNFRLRTVQVLPPFTLVNLTTFNRTALVLSQAPELAFPAGFPATPPPVIIELEDPRTLVRTLLTVNVRFGFEHVCTTTTCQPEDACHNAGTCLAEVDAQQHSRGACLYTRKEAEGCEEAGLCACPPEFVLGVEWYNATCGSQQAVPCDLLDHALPGGEITRVCANEAWQPPRVQTCVCEPGFFGPFCNVTTNLCGPEPCLNGGNCTDLQGTFFCDCHPGFGGPRCGTNIDDCQLSPCENGATCVDLVADFRCDCPARYQGRRCADCAPGFPNATQCDVFGYDRVLSDPVLGEGWVKFWWFERDATVALDPNTSVVDVLGQPWLACDPAAPHCLGRMDPALLEDNTELLAVETGGSAYRWRFDSSHPVAHAAWVALSEGTPSTALETGGVGGWNPTVLRGNGNGASQRSFRYELDPVCGARTAWLDDDGDLCQTTLQLGTNPLSGGSWQTPCVFGVDRLDDTECGRTKQPPAKALTLYFRVVASRPGYGCVADCRDQDECLVGDPCPAEATCLNRVGGFTCRCPSGFRFDGNAACVDVDECVPGAGLSECNVYANCANTVGSYTCACKSGFSGDGRTCVTDNVDALLAEATAEDLASQLNGSSPGAQAQRRALVNTVSFAVDKLANDTVSAEDESRVRAIADILTVATDTNKSALPSSTRTEIAQTATGLVKVLGNIKTQRQNNRPACGSSGPCLPGLTCGNCPALCGSCANSFAANSAREVFTQWTPNSTDHAKLKLEPRVPDAAANIVSETLDESSFQSAGQRFSINVVDPVATKPPNTKFAAVSFIADSESGPGDRRRRRRGVRRAVELDLEITVQVDISSLDMSSGNASAYVLMYFDTDTEEWVTVDCGANQTYDFTTDVFEAIVCEFRQYALFASEFVPETEVETALVTSLAQAFFDSTEVDTGADNLTAAESQEAAEVAQSVNEAVLLALDSVTTFLASNVEAGDPPVTLNTPTLTLQVSVDKPDSFNNKAVQPGSESVPAVAFPPDFDTALPGANTDYTLQVISFKNDNIFAWSSSSRNIVGGILDMTVRDGATVVPIQGVNVEILLQVPTGTETFQVVCKFFDEDLTDPDCEHEAGSPACLGAWSTEGVTQTSFSDRVVGCTTTHFSSFGADVDFTISGPDLGASNVDIRNSYVIYSTFAVFYLVIFAAFWYAKHEEATFEKALVAEQIVPRALKPDVTTADAKQSRTRAWLRIFGFNLKTRHQWLAALWPRGQAQRNVIPKRFLNACLLWATVSLGFGIDAMFTYTTYAEEESGADPNTVNTLAVRSASGRGHTYIPLEGLYTFLLSFPFIIAHAAVIGLYSKTDDELRFLQAKDRRISVKKFQTLRRSQDADDYLTLLGADVCKLIDKRLRLYRSCLIITCVYVLFGLCLSLAFVGAFGPKEQARWLLNVGVFTLAGSFVAAPVFLGLMSYRQVVALASGEGDIIVDLASETCTDILMNFASF